MTSTGADTTSTGADKTSTGADMTSSGSTGANTSSSGSTEIDDIPKLLASLLYNLKAYLLQGSSHDIDSVYFQYHVGRVLKLNLKLLEKEDPVYFSSVVTKCFYDYKKVLLLMKDFALRKLCGQYEVTH